MTFLHAIHTGISQQKVNVVMCIFDVRACKLTPAFHEVHTATCLHVKTIIVSSKEAIRSKNLNQNKQWKMQRRLQKGERKTTSLCCAKPASVFAKNEMKR